MKKILISSILSLCCCFMIGCGNNTADTKLVSLDKVREGLPSTLEDINNGEYSNLSIEDIHVSITDSDEIYKLRFGWKDNIFDNKEKFLQEVPNIIKYIFECDDIDVSKIKDTNTNESYDELLSKVGNDNFETPVIWYDDEYMSGFFHASFSQFWVDKGNLEKLYGNGNEDYLTFVPENFEEVKTYFMNSNTNFENEKYNLIDGEYSIQEAIDYVEYYYNNEFKYSFNKDLSLEIYEVEVLKLDDNTYCYNMSYTRKYNGIPFDSLKNGAMSSDGENRRFDMGNCIVANKDSIEFRTGVYSNQIVTEEGDGIDKIIPLDEVINIVSNELTNETVFKIEYIDLIYSLGGSQKQEATPIWKIMLSNPNDDTTLFVYCDILTGEISTSTFR